MKRLREVLLLALAIFLFAGSAVAGEGEGQHDRLVPLLGELDGWKAQPANGTSMVSARLKIITARRAYSKVDKGLVVSLVVNSGPVQEGDLQESSAEDEHNKVFTARVNGFWIKTTYNKNKNSGQLVVYLAYKEDSHSKLLVNFSGMDASEALLNIQKFDWDGMKVIVSPLL